MLPLEVIRKYYPDLSEEELKEIQEIVYLFGLCSYAAILWVGLDGWF